ncbi:MAG: RNA-processing protein [Thermoplasmata archaeon]|nr:MAG: RNA-processing protein [Thermoplasmata archaeon]
MQLIKIPKDRIGVLIGIDGKIKEEIEEKSGINIDVDSESGDVKLDVKDEAEPVMVLKVADIVNAIAVGFSPERAFRLFGEEIYFTYFDIRNYVGKDPKHVRRIRARIIGTEGKTRRIIEDLSGADISIHRNYIGVIGDLIELDVAKNAVDMVLNGSEHSSVYRYLENKRREFKRQRMGF